MLKPTRPWGTTPKSEVNRSSLDVHGGLESSVLNLVTFSNYLHQIGVVKLSYHWRECKTSRCGGRGAPAIKPTHFRIFRFSLHGTCSWIKLPNRSSKNLPTHRRLDAAWLQNSNPAFSRLNNFRWLTSGSGPPITATIELCYFWGGRKAFSHGRPHFIKCWV